MRAAIVVPRFGPDVLAGAERLARGFAYAVAAHGWQVEVWTTCASSHYTWQNDLPAGLSQDGPLTVRRFPITFYERDCFHQPLAAADAGRVLSPEMQFQWLHSGPHSAELYRQVGRDSPALDLVIGLPYAFPLVHYALHACRCPTVLWPCLHDEPIAYWQPMRLLFENVTGVFFNSPDEANLCLRKLEFRLRHWATVGVGVEPTGAIAAATVMPQLHGQPYLTYVGRLEGGKGVGLLYEYVARYCATGNHTLALAVIGSGPYEPPAAKCFVRLGPAANSEKLAVLQRALALCQPSLNESFSLTVMESWSVGRPVLVNAGCAVTRGHVQRCQGGLWFNDYDDFAGALDWLLANPKLAACMGMLGQRYVQNNYTWEHVLGRAEAALADWGIG